MGVVTYMQIKFHWSSQKVLTETHGRTCVKYYCRYVERVLVIFLHIQFNFSKTHEQYEQKFLFYQRSIENEWVLSLHNQDKSLHNHNPLEFHKIVDTSSLKQRSLEKGGNLVANILKIYGCYCYTFNSMLSWRF
jgi:hypothetical protein